MVILGKTGCPKDLVRRDQPEGHVWRFAPNRLMNDAQSYRAVADQGASYLGRNNFKEIIMGKYFFRILIQEEESLGFNFVLLMVGVGMSLFKECYC